MTIVNLIYETNYFLEAIKILKNGILKGPKNFNLGDVVDIPLSIGVTPYFSYTKKTYKFILDHKLLLNNIDSFRHNFSKTDLDLFSFAYLRDLKNNNVKEYSGEIPSDINQIISKKPIPLDSLRALYITKPNLSDKRINKLKIANKLPLDMFLHTKGLCVKCLN